MIAFSLGRLEAALLLLGLVGCIKAHAFVAPCRPRPRYESAARPLRRWAREHGADQSKSPIVEALSLAAARIKAPFFFPGHKMGRGLPVGLPGPFAETNTALNRTRLHRDAVWQYDLPEIPELDNLFAPEGPIRDAETLAAETFGGAQRTWFLVNGSTAGVLAALLALVRRHQQEGQQHPARSGRSIQSKVLLPRNVHKSAINGLILAGAVPVFLSPVYDPAWDICHGVPIESALQQALEEHASGSEVAAVLLVSPTYHGAVMDIEQAALLCAKFKVPLIVDEAHGAHLAFLEVEINEPGNAGPLASRAMTGALAQGADLVVQSTHKTLTAVSQCAMMHAGKGPLVDSAMLEFVGSALQLVQSSSPNYVLLASLDGARWQLGSPLGGGRTALHRAQKLAAKAKRLLLEETPFPILKPPDRPKGGAFVGLDPLRLTVGTMGTGMSGFDADEVLIEEHGVYAELPASRTLTFAVGPGSEEEDVDCLVAAFKALATLVDKGKRDRSRDMAGEEASSFMADFPPFDGKQAAAGSLKCGPRDAYFTASEVLSTNDERVVGRASAETVCPYPPGIPVLLPGEIITVEVLRFLKGVLSTGGSVTGCSDPSLGKIRVLCWEKEK
ncbi:hypothetical protein NSK_003168 [Nannochloropsis salina CCMP1776]|uniref:Orn/Lys/Arg decarboxylases family 1 pyridoxal-P attachment site domain-containing protein n=1 Tax=Nannochloropsis salina CCMP1776 TaxID=1027361 RepID=A0A4D9D2J8_9STRA|nr:hypothetical protein NSK_003168 [Nannochloropsis salina CCMP1776]|eukprot:TFJ85660.1 hypothetical protein NSK_003168 [Nannochloropsis salina CCMP1776]